MPDYQKAKIYTIRSYSTDDIYIGSTCQSLAKRIGSHRRDYNCFINGKKKYVTSFKLIERRDYYIELLEMFPCNCRNELEKREGELIREYENCVNKTIAGRTKQQYYIDNRENIKQYYIDNQDYLLKIQKQYYIDNKSKKQKLAQKKEICDCGSIITHVVKARHKKSTKHIKYMDYERDYDRGYDLIEKIDKLI